MSFQWLEFLDRQGIEYASERQRAGWLNIKCPFCGDDSGQHLGIHLDSGVFSCFRDPTHKGRNVPKLIQALLGCGWQQATQLAGDWKEPGPADLNALRTQLDGLDGTPADRPKPLRYPTPDFLPIRDKGATRPFYDYLIDKRGFNSADIPDLIQQYRLTACLSGDLRARLILPFLGRKNQVYGWQGRSIIKGAKLRYISHPSSNAVKQILFNYGPAYDADKRNALVICEGGPGTLKIDYYGQGKGIRAVGTLGTAYAAAQVALIYKLAPRYERVVICFDPGADANSWSLAERLAIFSPVVAELPQGLSGPDDLSPAVVIPFISQYL